MRRFATLLAIATIFLISGCAPKSPSPILTPQVHYPLEGVHWRLTGFSDHAIKVPQRAWMKLKNGRYIGFAGCNGLSGRYRVEGKKISFTMGPSTKMFCTDMKGETLFRKQLLKSDRNQLKDGMLRLYHGKRMLLQFLPK